MTDAGTIIKDELVCSQTRITLKPYTRTHFSRVHPICVILACCRLQDELERETRPPFPKIPRVLFLRSLSNFRAVPTLSTIWEPGTGQCYSSRGNDERPRASLTNNGRTLDWNYISES